jgi:hypothetical protein
LSTSLVKIIATTDNDALDKIAAAHEAILSHLNQAEASNAQDQVSSAPVTSRSNMSS